MLIGWWHEESGIGDIVRTFVPIVAVGAAAVLFASIVAILFVISPTAIKRYGLCANAAPEIMELWITLPTIILNALMFCAVAPLSGWLFILILLIAVHMGYVVDTEELRVDRESKALREEETGGRRQEPKADETRKRQVESFCLDKDATQ